MAARIIDGKKIAAEIRAEIRAEVTALRAASGRAPGLAVVLLGEDPGSAAYVRAKTRACQEAGLVSRLLTPPPAIPLADLVALVEDLNRDPSIHGILVQLPLPDHLDERRVLEAVNPAKDVDGFTYDSIGRLAENRARLLPCTPAGVLTLLDREGIRVEGRRAVVVGRSAIVGKPLALLLLHRHATVTICHSRTCDLAAETGRADLLVVAAGRPGLVTGAMVRPGAVVLDVGVNRVAGSLVGDVDFATVSQVASALTPVPGGVGPMTVAMLLRNTVEAFKDSLAVDGGSRRG
jgi:methylenetetrahydrofolate dehydrogenase (NADP+)/methenyltetrahydrofolate cyclohydrolase